MPAPPAPTNDQTPGSRLPRRKLSLWGTQGRESVATPPGGADGQLPALQHGATADCLATEAAEILSRHMTMTDDPRATPAGPTGGG